MSMPSRWANTKLRCNRCDSDSTGLYLHFKEGCPNDDGDEKMNLRISLIDYLITTDNKLKQCGHKKGNCSCSECEKLRRLELKWILRLGIFNGESGLNSRNIMNSAARVQY